MIREIISDLQSGTMQVVHADFARKLERERDDYRLQFELALGGWKYELDQLRKELETLQSSYREVAESFNTEREKVKELESALKKISDECPCDNDGRGCPCQDVARSALTSMKGQQLPKPNI